MASSGLIAKIKTAEKPMLVRKTMIAEEYGMEQAEKFGVPPRKLLSHVLRYSLELKQK